MLQILVKCNINCSRNHTNDFVPTIICFSIKGEKLINGFYSISGNLKSLLINDNGELEKKITLICYNKISSNIHTFYNVNDPRKVSLISNYVASSLTGFMLNLINNKETNKQMVIEILSNLLEATNISIHKLLN